MTIKMQVPVDGVFMIDMPRNFVFIVDSSTGYCEVKHGTDTLDQWLEPTPISLIQFDKMMGVVYQRVVQCTGEAALLVKRNGKWRVRAEGTFPFCKAEEEMCHTRFDSTLVTYQFNIEKYVNKSK